MDRALSAPEVDALVAGDHDDVFSVLGPHVIAPPEGPAVAIRAFLPDAGAVQVVPLDTTRKPRPMERLHPAGFYEAIYAGEGETFPYRMHVSDHEGAITEVEDAYRFPSTLSDYDLHLLGEG